MSFMRRYWQGELVRTHTWIKELTFTRPFRLDGFGQSLPSGHYRVELSEVEVAIRDRTVKQVVRCMVPIPPALLPPGVRTMFRNVDHTQLERCHAEDTRSRPHRPTDVPAPYLDLPRNQASGQLSAF